jgi:hypothetical protein
MDACADEDDLFEYKRDANLVFSSSSGATGRHSCAAKAFIPELDHGGL